jgi:hypothetical protein
MEIQNDLFVLYGPEGAAYNPAYRGTDQTWPTYCDSVPADHEINRLFMWYVEPNGGGPVHDLERALRYAQLCNIYFPAQHFEVVEVTRGAAPPETRGNFAGFDLSNGGLSLLCWGFETPDVSKLPEPINTLSLLLDRFFEPQLNENGLFQTIDVASFCLRSMNSLQNLRPGLYESEHPSDLREYEVMGIYILPPIGNGVRPVDS